MDFFLLLKYALLGLIQGFTEPIPVSSSGHLVIARHLFDVEIEGLSFEVFVNFASLLAVLLIYRKDIMRLIHGSLRYIRTKDAEAKSDFKLVVYLILATIPAGIIGVLFNDYIHDALSGVVVIGVTLLVTGVALWLIRNLRGRKQDRNITVRDALIVGFAQAVALIPGISRSGATIVAAMGLGMKQDTALRFSFLLYIPISLGGMILETSTVVDELRNNSSLLLPYLAAFIVALVASYYALRWFMGIMARGNLWIFSAYCFVLGTCVLVFM